MNKLQVINNEVWFCAKDVCNILEIKNVKKNLFMNWQKKELKERLLLKDWD